MCNCFKLKRFLNVRLNFSKGINVSSTKKHIDVNFLMYFFIINTEIYPYLNLI